MRQITADDFATVYAICSDPTVSPYMNFEPTDPAGFKPFFDSYFYRDHFWLFQSEGVDAAICSAHFGRERIASSVSIMTLAVKSEFQGKGLGRRVMLQVIEFLKAKNPKRIDLLVESDNLKAQKLYQSLGFEVDGVLRKFFRRAGSDEYLDEIIMSLIN